MSATWSGGWPPTRIWLADLRSTWRCIRWRGDRGGGRRIGRPRGAARDIFKPFRQGPGVPAHSPGMGVGLALVARFAELHGGRAWLEDRPGGGARFKVFLPGQQVDRNGGL